MENIQGIVSAVFMTKTVKTYLTALFAAVFFLCSGEEKAKEQNAILASVNGSPISLQDILPLTRAEEFRAFSTSTGRDLQNRILDIRRRAVDELIDRKLILEDYAGKNFEISDRDIESALDDMAEQSGIRSRSEFTAALRRQGSSIEELRRKVRDTMIIQLMLQREYLTTKNITPQEMHAVYLENLKKQTNGDSIELAMILLDEKNLSQSDKIAKELARSPERFSALAERWSSGPGKEDGGKLGRIRKHLLRKEFASALKKIEINRIYGPVKTPEGIVFLKVLSVISAKTKSFKESIPEIRKEIEARQRLESKKSYTQRLRKNAIIRYFF